MKELITNIRTVRMPNQMATVLSNRYLMHVLSLQADGASPRSPWEPFTRSEFCDANAMLMMVIMTSD